LLELRDGVESGFLEINTKEEGSAVLVVEALLVGSGLLAIEEVRVAAAVPVGVPEPVLAGVPVPVLAGVPVPVLAGVPVPVLAGVRVSVCVSVLAGDGVCVGADTLALLVAAEDEVPLPLACTLSEGVPLPLAEAPALTEAVAVGDTDWERVASGVALCSEHG
jgi:hypothetical protein